MPNKVALAAVRDQWLGHHVYGTCVDNRTVADPKAHAQTGPFAMMAPTWDTRVRPMALHKLVVPPRSADSPLKNPSRRRGAQHKAGTTQVYAF